MSKWHVATYPYYSDDTDLPRGKNIEKWVAENAQDRVKTIVRFQFSQKELIVKCKSESDAIYIKLAFSN